MSYGESNSTTESESQHHIDRMTPGDIHRGSTGSGSVSAPGRIIYLSGSQIGQLEAMPYYVATPFRQMLIGNLVYAVRNFFLDGLDKINPPQITESKDHWSKRYTGAIKQLRRTRDELANAGPWFPAAVEKRRVDVETWWHELENTEPVVKQPEAEKRSWWRRVWAS